MEEDGFKLVKSRKAKKNNKVVRKDLKICVKELEKEEIEEITR